MVIKRMEIPTEAPTMAVMLLSGLSFTVGHEGRQE